jgi:hypothetical protein
MAIDVEHELRRRLHEIAEDHALRTAEIDPTEPLSDATRARHNSQTRTMLRTLLASVPIGSDVAAEVVAAEELLAQ